MKKPLVIIPSFNTGPTLVTTVCDVMEHWKDGPIWVVIDGSTDDSINLLLSKIEGVNNIRIIRFEKNKGKGAAVLAGSEIALREGFTHACVFDADGQHCAADIGPMIQAATDDGSDFVAGTPIFGPEAPISRVKGRRVGNTFAKIETLFSGPTDSLFGMRVYPIATLVKLMRKAWGARRYDFDTEIVVKLTWAGLRAIDFPTPVRYLTREQGGISHFKYIRDNLLLTKMHTKLLLQMPFHLPTLISNKSSSPSAQAKKNNAHDD